MDQFAVDDLLDFSKDLEPTGTDDGSFDNAAAAGGGCSADSSTLTAAAGGCSADSSTVTAVDSLSSNSNSGCALNHGLSASAGADYGGNFSGELCVPYDDLAELEWLSNFTEESFSTEDLQRLQLISGFKAGRPVEGSRADRLPRPNSPPTFDPDMPVPAKARSKRSRAGPGKWASRLLLLSDPPTQPEPEVGKKVVRPGPKKKQPVGSEGSMEPGEARRCLHCLTDKTPQWRTGPMGPKTLCNACGVRYKSGRLVPEYRPASSPTFMLTKHSNSHRKVLELRRQKEMLRAQQLQQEHFLQSQNMVFNVSSDDDYLIHQHVGPDFRQLI